jgi:hypothetical protein
MDYMGKKLLGAIFLPSDTVVEDPPLSVDTVVLSNDGLLAISY